MADQALPRVNPLRAAIHRLRNNSSAEVYDEFTKQFELYVNSTRDDFLLAPADSILVRQGQAQMATKILSFLTER